MSRSGPTISIGTLVIDRYQYLILMGLCLLLTLPLEFVFKARVWRQPRRLAASVLPVAAIFIVWDLIAVGRDHWGFSEKLTTGWEVLPGLPIDEVVFFVAIPVCALLTFEAVRTVLGWFAKREQEDRAR